MPFDPTPTRQAGGIIVLEYSVDGDLNQHTIRQHCAPFNPEPDGAGNFLYTNVAPKSTITEAGIKQTALALANRWAPYYHSSAQIILKELWYNSGGVMTNIPLPPESAIGIIAGSFMGLVTPVMKRTFEFFSSQNVGPNRTYLMQHPCELVATQRGLTATEGGFDARDVNMAAYLCSPRSGVVGPDGYPLQGAGRVALFWAHSLVSIPGGVASDIIISTTLPEGVTTNVLWVDTSSGTPPYPLKAYSAMATAWYDVGGIGNVVTG